MDDDLKAVVGRLTGAASDDEAHWSMDPNAPPAVDVRVDDLRTLLAALRQRDEALESLRAERDLYRLVAVNQGWNWRLCDAYGRDEYQKQREKHVDDCVAVAQSHAARAILTGSETNAR